MDNTDELNKPYNPKDHEEKVYKQWEKSGYFNPDNLPVSQDTSSKIQAPRFCITMAPPNVTGSLHMGHALEYTLSDILVRFKRMRGYETLWLPGTDHAGIATQNVVEKELKKQGVSRHDLGREKFLEKIWEWKEKYGDTITNQLKKLGASCDWSRERFTMDAGYVKAVETAFKHYYDKGWIYQGERVINWCPRCATGLSDLEVEYKEAEAELIYIKYPLADGSGYVTVATVRPETMLGDAAVAVNPKDERYKNLVGRKVVLPIQNREIPIIADETIDMEFGTGAVKVTPAHDPADFEMRERHNLPVYKVIDEKGRMTPEAKICLGLKTEECRKEIVKELEKLGLIEKKEKYTHNISKCYRCDTTIEPILSKQWFLKMKELAANAINAVKSGKIKFHPENFTKTYLDWLENIRDWTISRQIWWGHKIPLDGVDDVLDTWFSSALWPFAALGWPEQTTNVLTNDRGIINLWDARMIFSGLEFMDEKPFSDLIIHATVMTREGKRMSKSLGTGIDPVQLIEEYGADAIRFALVWQALGGQDIKWQQEAVMAGKKFLNKIWNASRFVLGRNGNSKSEILNPKQIQNKENAEIIEKFEKTKKEVGELTEKYEFGPALHALYEFFWHEFCDIYLEQAKKSNSEETNQTLLYVLSGSLKMAHPFIPFMTEVLWSKLPLEEKKLLMVESW
ncbi:MAG: valine--tRNA ligase [Candidatus Sungbacteria bacterium]|uniref:Valine--tRNA ligase n=1 Tax=Candidatus Sungiibacteriota bacterium TaxID=2750080 RepID=A0A9D6DSB6_9BACT|nr:valine--tRNA ligase [Candidatus Sungbacteria bacterium]